MQGHKLVLIVCVLAASLRVAIALPLTGAQTPLEVKVAEATLRRLAVKTVMPSFPESRLVSNKTGVLVVSVVVDEEGKVFHSNVREAPAPALGEAAEAAVKQWTFRSTTVAGRSARVEGHLTFYYVIERGRGIFLNAGEMPTKK
ncbi:MAG: TonB family protein [Terriglobia bacterium]